MRAGVDTRQVVGRRRRLLDVLSNWLKAPHLLPQEAKVDRSNWGRLTADLGTTARGAVHHNGAQVSPGPPTRRVDNPPDRWGPLSTALRRAT